MELIERWGYLVLGLAGVAAFISYLVVTTKRDPATGMYQVDQTLFGALGSYVKKRGGLTKREVALSGVVVGIIVCAVIFAFVTGHGVRGR
jgi:peptidoglycan/LPS O-acetylase OafA/YrhL